MWTARTKTDLIIEVWEKLDCESVGAEEIEAISTAVESVFGTSAVDSPMVIARMLADEGAELRHAEIMQLYVARVEGRTYDKALSGILDITSLKSTARSMEKLEQLRLRYKSDGDREGLRLVRELAVAGKQSARETAERPTVEAVTKLINSEIAEWLTVWLQTPELFSDWLRLRQGSSSFKGTFGKIDDD